MRKSSLSRAYLCVSIIHSFWYKFVRDFFFECELISSAKLPTFFGDLVKTVPEHNILLYIQLRFLKVTQQWYIHSQIRKEKKSIYGIWRNSPQQQKCSHRCAGQWFCPGKLIRLITQKFYSIDHIGILCVVSTKIPGLQKEIKGKTTLSFREASYQHMAGDRPFQESSLWPAIVTLLYRDLSSFNGFSHYL